MFPNPIAEPTAARIKPALDAQRSRCSINHLSSTPQVILIFCFFLHTEYHIRQYSTNFLLQKKGNPCQKQTCPSASPKSCISRAKSAREMISARISTFFRKDCSRCRPGCPFRSDRPTGSPSTGAARFPLPLETAPGKG